MFARVSRYSGGDADRLVEGFRSVTDELEGIEGFSHAYFLVDRDAAKAVSMVVYRTEEALTASVARADQMRAKATEMGGASIDSVEHYEIALTAGRQMAGQQG